SQAAVRRNCSATLGADSTDAGGGWLYITAAPRGRRQERCGVDEGLVCAALDWRSCRSV
ncbi:hypothetical protein MMC34_008564, partial [Xylographa carneopallida]|nr:hypothetical protein [Xylographa carneopallida]